MINVTCGLTAYPGSAGSGSLPNLRMPSAHFRHIATSTSPQMTTKWSDQSAISKCQVVVWVHSFIEQDLFDNSAIRQYHSDSSDQSAMKIRVKVRVRLRVALFSHFLQRITKTSTLSSANFTVGNMLLKERTQTTTWQQNGHRAIPVIRPLR